jgi:hypothetical protein
MFPWLAAGGVAAVVVLAAVFIPYFPGSNEPEGPFEVLTWRLADHLSTGFGDRKTEYSISNSGKAAGLYFLIVDFRLPPGNVERFDDDDSIESFKLHSASGSPLTPSSSTYSGTRIGGSAKDALTEVKGTILFTVEESAAHRNDFRFQFKQHPQVLLNDTNYKPDA